METPTFHTEGGEGWVYKDGVNSPDFPAEGVKDRFNGPELKRLPFDSNQKFFNVPINIFGKIR